ncbi:MAG: hypothetical protein N3A62_10750 [Thermodesulfovibrionales bacterium]|nr:hypothetical protein [Thermodesulfovibrionales bacterium]
MWGVIGGYLVSNFAEVLVKEVVKEVVKEIGKKDKDSLQQQKKPLSFSSGQVMIIDYIPVKNDVNQQITAN